MKKNTNQTIVKIKHIELKRLIQKQFNKMRDDPDSHILDYLEGIKNSSRNPAYTYDYWHLMDHIKARLFREIKKYVDDNVEEQ